ncbi:MAG TPA: hypothetical protein ENJ45_01840 [Phaeodactylibacter sp.]|nr:hypothetical protein [Phaeodactylibacter sp.]
MKYYRKHKFYKTPPINSQINYNGRIFSAEHLMLSADNRAFLYGDGVFETLRLVEGHIPFLKHHYDRLMRGLELLQIEVPSTFDLCFFCGEINKIAKKEKATRVRFNAYRASGGKYSPRQDHLQYLISGSPLSSAFFEVPPKGLSAVLYEGIPLVNNVLSSVKTMNALPYVLAGKYRVERKAEEVLLLNQNGSIAEAGSSNVYIWDGDKLITPSLKEACIAGVVRAVLLAGGEGGKFAIVEGEISIADIRKADAVLLSNSIQGIRWLSTFEDIPYEERIGRKLVKELLEYLNAEAIY